MMEEKRKNPEKSSHSSSSFDVSLLVNCWVETFMTILTSLIMHASERNIISSRLLKLNTETNEDEKSSALRNERRGKPLRETWQIQVNSFFICEMFIQMNEWKWEKWKVKVDEFFFWRGRRLVKNKDFLWKWEIIITIVTKAQKIEKKLSRCSVKWWTIGECASETSEKNDRFMMI